MKWERAVPQHGDRRVRTQFAWRPKTMRVDKLDVTVWLERYVDYEEYTSEMYGNEGWHMCGHNTLTGHLTDKLNGKDWVAEGKKQAAAQVGQASISTMLTNMQQQLNQQLAQQQQAAQYKQYAQHSQLQLPFPGNQWSSP